MRGQIHRAQTPPARAKAATRCDFGWVGRCLRGARRPAAFVSARGCTPRLRQGGARAGGAESQGVLLARRQTHELTTPDCMPRVQVAVVAAELMPFDEGERNGGSGKARPCQSLMEREPRTQPARAHCAKWRVVSQGAQMQRVGEGWGSAKNAAWRCGGEPPWRAERRRLRWASPASGPRRATPFCGLSAKRAVSAVSGKSSA